MAGRPKTDIALVLLAVAYNGGEATVGGIVQRIQPDEWERVWNEMGYNSSVALIVQNIGSRVRRLEKEGMLTFVGGRGVKATYRFARPEDRLAVEQELRAKLVVTDGERYEIEGLAKDAEVKIDLFVGNIETKWGEPHIEAAVILTSNKGRAEHGFWVNRKMGFSWLEEIDRMLTEA